MASLRDQGRGMTCNTREFELAVRSLHGDLYRFAFWLARDKHVAEDLVQDCFQRAWCSWASLNDQAALKKWLFTILKREFLRRFERPQIDTVDITDVELPASDQLGMDEAYALRQALASAPQALCDVLLMQVLGGFSAEELALAGDTTAGAITTRLCRARQWLREKLSETEAECTSGLL